MSYSAILTKLDFIKCDVEGLELRFSSHFWKQSANSDR